MINKARLLALTGITALLSIASINAADNQKGTTQNAQQPKDEKAGQAAPKQELTQADITKVSEAFGHFIGRNLNSPGIKFDLESIIKGMRDGAAGKPAPMSDKEYEQMMAKVQENAFNTLSQENLKAANDYLAKNAKADKVIELKPGKLQYQVLKEGTGAPVQPHSTPLINYVGRYIDGTVFGSSEDVGGPITIPLDQTIPGFSEGLVGMKEGEKRKLWVHPDLGYGTAGHLPPNSLLIFEVEIVKAAQQHDTTQADEEDDDIAPIAVGNDKGDDMDTDDDSSESLDADTKSDASKAKPIQKK